LRFFEWLQKLQILVGRHVQGGKPGGKGGEERKLKGGNLKPIRVSAGGAESELKKYSVTKKTPKCRRKAEIEELGSILELSSKL